MVETRVDYFIHFQIFSPNGLHLNSSSIRTDLVENISSRYFIQDFFLSFRRQLVYIKNIHLKK